MKAIFTTGQIAKICAVSPRTVSKWIDAGRLHGFRIPGSQDRRVSLANLLKFLDDNGMPHNDLASIMGRTVLAVSLPADLAADLSRELPAAQGWAIQHVTAMADAIRAIALHLPNVILIDTAFKLRDTLALLVTLQAINSRAARLARVCVLVGEDQGGLVSELSAAGADEVLIKPVPMRVVAEELARAVDEAQVKEVVG